MFEKLFKEYNVGSTGLVPSPPDERDIALSSITPEIQRYPEEFPPIFDLTISNQGSVPSCVGHACATIKQAQEFRERENVFFNGDEIYRECKKIDGIPNVNGTYLRTGMKVLQKIGAKANGNAYRIARYARVDDISFEGLKKAKTMHGELLAGFYGSNEGWRGEVVRPHRSGENQWAHAIAITGYEKNYLIGHNSWGEKAHNKGLFKIPADYLPFEAWISLDEANTLGEPIKTGWVASEFLSITGGSIKTTVNLNIRTSPEIKQGNIIMTLPRERAVQFTNREPVKDIKYNWVEVIYT